MRKILRFIFPFSIILLLSCSSKANRQESDPMVYICTGPISKRYHINPRCYGLTRCSGDIEKITEKEAISMGRTPCSYCIEGEDAIQLPIVEDDSEEEEDMSLKPEKPYDPAEYL
jgi:hypothetical protein